MEKQPLFAKIAGSVAVQRLAFSLLRGVMPVAVIGKRAILTRYSDVKDILDRNTEFTVSRINGPKMDQMLVPFFLGMDSSPQHDREKDMTRRAVRRDDLALIRDIAREQSGELIARAYPGGSIDIAGSYARPAALAMVSEYFGVPGPDTETMKRWMRILFHQLFLNLQDDPDVYKRALTAAREMKPYLLRLIAHTKEGIQQGRSLPDTLLVRMTAMQNDYDWLDDDCIRRNISGLIIGAVDTTNRCVAYIMDVLFRRPRELALAREAALADDMETVAGYCFEALRFMPHNPIVLRHCENGAVVGKGTSYQRTIAPGTTVYASTMSAMFDSRAYPKPGSFDPSRTTPYMHFSYGMHECFGKYVNEVQIPELVAGLLRLRGLRRAKGKQGKLLSDSGGFPDRLVAVFDRD